MESRSKVLATVAVGGAIGAEARYLLGAAFPAAADVWPWTTFWINIVGCLLIGVLYTVLTELMEHPHPLLRPLLGVGVLGGFTTFSTWSVETVRLVDADRWGTALGYALATPLVAMAACGAAMVLTRRIGGRV